MRLYILGPAFGLPSIDAECIAAVALVKTCCESTGQNWELVASHEATSGTHFPLLEDDGASYSGFSVIARHLTDASGNIAGLAADLTSEQSAEAAALHPFVESSGLPLLDISLYVSFENYRLRTRSSFTQILPWYANFLLPPRVRSAARARTAHLGVSNVDVDSVHEDVIEKPQSLKQQQPHQFEQHETEKHAKRLLGQRRTLKSMLRGPEHTAVFRIKAFADDFFEPLQDILGNKQYLLGTSAPSAIDCLAFGYLSLMLYPRMPHAWLETSLKSQYAPLKSYIDRLRARLDMDTTPAEAFRQYDQNKSTDHEDIDLTRTTPVNSKLPWTQPQRLGLGGAVVFLGREIRQQLPMPNSGAQVKTLPQQDYETSWLGKTLPYLPALSAIAFTGCWFYLDRPWPRGESVHLFGRRRLTDFGAAGALLGGLGMQMQSAQANAGKHNVQQYGDGAIQVEVVEDELQTL